VYRHGGHAGSRPRLAGWLPLLLLGSGILPAPAAAAQEQAPREPPPASIRLDSLATGYARGESLGFALHDTTLDEQLYRRDQGAERGVLWSARFVSRWALTEDQLDRWNAQVIGLLADAVGSDVRLGPWERLGATDVGEQRVAYRYLLVTPSGIPAGEATVVVFSRGDEVGLSGTAAVGTRLPLGAVALARLMDTRPERRIQGASGKRPAVLAREAVQPGAIGVAEDATQRE
jgi:hypothetical protein